MENLAGIYINEKEYVTAIDLLLKASFENPDDARIKYITAAGYYRLKDKINGREFLRKALSMDPKMLETFYSFYPEGRTDKGIQKIINSGS